MKRRGNGFSLASCAKRVQPHDPNKTSRVVEARPSRTRLVAADLVRPDLAPIGVQDQISNFMRIANHRGITYIPTVEIAQYCLKNMWDYAKLKIKQYDEERKPTALAQLLHRYAA